jgi:hypothetical protein
VLLDERYNVVKIHPHGFCVGVCGGVVLRANYAYFFVIGEVPAAWGVHWHSRIDLNFMMYMRQPTSVNLNLSFWHDDVWDGECHSF